MRKKIITLISLIFIFLFLRFYNLNNSFFFLNDMGRDMSVLQLWKDTGKPPLLGPQTSALPFNQSAIYFYLIYPGFLISHGNPISLVYTLAFVYLLVFILGIYLLGQNNKLIKTIFIAFFLISIHPQYIIQGRYVWNPSFVSPFIISAILSFYLLIKKFSWSKAWMFSFSLALAVSLSYSIAPLLIVLVIYWLLFNRQKIFPIFVTLFSSFFAINLSTIFFELRHQFLLTNSLFNKSSSPQSFLSFNEKLNSLSQYIFSTGNQNINLILLLTTIITCLFIIIKNIKKTKSLQFITAFLLFSLTLTTLIIPVTVHAHYIFAFTCLIFILISTFNTFTTAVILILLSLIYLNPIKINSYFKTASRTYQQMSACFKNYCNTHREPTFVSVQSDYHPYHNGLEHRYLLNKMGCQVKNIETENGSTSYMSLILDNGKYDEKTSFYELELFGKYKDIETFNCLPNFKIKVLQKVF